MKVHSVAYEDIVIPATRQRRVLKVEDVLELASSIDKDGLLHPVILRADGDGNQVLVAGERRIRAMCYIWDMFDSEVKCGEYRFPKHYVPCLWQGELDEATAYRMELEENIRRVDLSWQEKADALNRLYSLECAEAEAKGEEAPSLATVAKLVHGSSEWSQASASKDLAAAQHLHDPDVAKAPSLREAVKVIQRKEQAAANAALALRVGAKLTSTSHSLLQGDCFDLMSDLQESSFDVILTDPPYGVDADSFGDSGGRTGGSHFYDDSFRTWTSLIERLAPALHRLAKPESHLYCFCDVDNFVILKQVMLSANWNVFRTPFVWHNPTANRAPWPAFGPMRRWQLCLYAIKGDRPCNSLKGDVLEFRSDENLGHQAQKPVGLFRELLSRSVRPGDKVLDPFCGSGPIFPAAHELKCFATGIEQDPAAAGIAIKRLESLK